MATTTAIPAPAPGGPPQRRFTVAEYHKLMDVGILTQSDRCHLIHGLIVEKPVIHPPHATAVSKLYRRLLRLAGDVAVVRAQQPITLSDSEPEPDLVVAAGNDDDYAAAHPRPRHVLLVVEVADTSLLDDQTVMLRMYAAERLPVYWIVNIPDRRVEVYTDPRGGKNPTYRTRTDFAPGDDLPVVVGGTEVGRIPVSELLP